MSTPLIIAQSIIGVLLTLLILVQAKGTGLGRSLSAQSYHSRRGAEKLIFRMSIVLAIAFACISIAQLFVK